MAEKSTIARPYAQAVFELARETKALAPWSDQLAYAGAVAADPAMQALIGNPSIERERLVQLFLDVCADKLDAAGQNFIRLLAENKRLELLPEIAEVYEAMRAEHEGSVEAEVITALPLDEAQQKQLADKLKQRLGRDVVLSVKTDESLLGGAIVRADDLVIDGTAAGQLTRLANTLLH
ncbi:MAG TPA: F0F1 ATP synthase subunit delta [Gammaproteobacteria bacterium]|nr:F0F1 ATP synthase subunit delta [Gammaproteobacteria bacterium]